MLLEPGALFPDTGWQRIDPLAGSIRQPEIITIARRDGRVGVDDLAVTFDVVLHIFRGELSGRTDTGLPERVHGGVMRRSVGGLVGDLTALFFAQFRVHSAAIGAAALDPGGDSLDHDLAEMRVTKAVVRQARQSCVVCAAEKLGRSAPVRLVSLADVAAIFTDAALPPDLAHRGAEWQTGIHLAG